MKQKIRKRYIYIFVAVFLAIISFLAVYRYIFPSSNEKHQKSEKTRENPKDDNFCSLERNRQEKLDTEVNCEKKLVKNDDIQIQSTKNIAQDAKMSSKTDYYSIKENDNVHFYSKLNERITELEGLGTYCFANSAMQCLNNISCVKEYFTSLQIKNESDEIVTSVFQKVFFSMGNEKKLVLESYCEILTDKLKAKNFNFNAYSCPLEFISALISQIYLENTQSDEFVDLSHISKDVGDEDLEKFDSHLLKLLFATKYIRSSNSAYLYTFGLTVEATKKAKTSKLVHDYFSERKYNGELPKVLILRTQLREESTVTSKELTIDDYIFIDNVRYKLSSWIVAPDRGSVLHFYAIIRDEKNNFFMCNNTEIHKYNKKEVEDSVYLVFYEQE